jgi:tryptophan halogenase
MDRVSATANGWRWTASSPAGSLSGQVFSSAHARDADAESGETIPLRQGRWRELFVRNCVAIGDAAVAIEPLEWTNLHLAHSQIDRLVSMMPGRDCAPVELAEFNRQCGQEADRIRDFLCLHYFCARRSEAFWRDAAAITPPPSLAHTLSLFAERGRLPYYEEETFTRDSWLAVLLGQGVKPRRLDPMTDLVPSPEAERAMAAIAESAHSFHLTAPASAALDLNPRGAR